MRILPMPRRDRPSALLLALFAALALLVPGPVAACGVDVLVSPPNLTNGIRNAELRWAILTELYQARESVDVAMYSFTDPGLAWALVDLHEKGVRVRVYLDKQEAAIRASRDEVLVDNGVAVKLDGKSGLMHHKFAVIDGRVVVTGSYNWSQSAEDANMENVVILRCGCGLAEFRRRFEEYWSGR